jgi:hypothetical protein
VIALWLLFCIVCGVCLYQVLMARSEKKLYAKHRERMNAIYDKHR